MYASLETLLLGAFILFLLVGFGLWQVRIYMVLSEEKLRSDIAKDLHDDVCSTLNSINFFAEALEKKSLTDREGKRFLELISLSSNEAKERISDMIWIIHPRDDNWGSLFLKCKRYASDILDCRDIQCTFTIKGTPPATVGLTVKKHTWLIFKELIINIAMHANASRVEIIFTIENDQIVLSVSDNGEGFNPGELSDPGYGLINIKSRVDTLRGKLNLSAAPQRGTHWLMQIPV